jgi:arginine repressor
MRNFIKTWLRIYHANRLEQKIKRFIQNKEIVNRSDLVKFVKVQGFSEMEAQAKVTVFLSPKFH